MCARFSEQFGVGLGGVSRGEDWLQTPMKTKKVCATGTYTHTYIHTRVVEEDVDVCAGGSQVEV